MNENSDIIFCDPRAEVCGEMIEQVVRPDSTALVHLVGGWLGQFFAPTLAVLVYILIKMPYDFNADWFENLKKRVDFNQLLMQGLLPTWLALAALSFPFLTSLFYLLFEVDLFLGATIEHWVSNLTPIVYITAIVFYIIWIHQNYHKGGVELYWICLVLDSVFGWNYTIRTMSSSPGAIKHIDPQWDYVEIGLYLYPSLFYALGIANNQKRHDKEERFPEKVIGEDGIEVIKTDGKDDIRDKISGGP